ncbi:MAG: hypothetical protein MHM6MM_008157 [Cercozoa sp. M6MM]
MQISFSLGGKKAQKLKKKAQKKASIKPLELSADNVAKADANLMKSAATGEKQSAGSSAVSIAAMRAKQRAKQLERAQKKKLEREQLANLMADPTVYSYDEVYDEIQAQKESAKAAKQKGKKKKGARFMKDMLRANEERKVQRDLAEEHMVAREREKERRENGGEDEKPAFITKAYKKMLDEQRQKEEELKRIRDLERKTTIEKGHSMDFTAGLFKKLMGNEVPTPANDKSDSESDESDEGNEEQRRRSRSRDRSRSHRRRRSRSDSRRRRRRSYSRSRSRRR